MKFKIDHDLHIHSHLSFCADGDMRENKYTILKYAEDNGLKTVCVTDHYWDSAVAGASDWYKGQNFEHISEIKPLPQIEGIKFLFGCEAELDRFLTLSIPKERFDDFDFIIIPTTHMHMGGFVVNGDEDAKQRAVLWKDRFNAVLDMDLPFGKVGIAHLTCELMYQKEPNGYLAVVNNISDGEYAEIFKKAADKGVGIELNFNSLSMNDDEFNQNLRPFKIAKQQGCKFYFGSDSHHPETLEKAMANFTKIADALDLEESDKFIIKGI